MLGRDDSYLVDRRSWQQLFVSIRLANLYIKIRALIDLSDMNVGEIIRVKYNP